MVRCDFHRPDNAVLIVILFYGSRHGTAHTDAVTAHVHRICLAVFIQIGRVQFFAVFCEQFEYLSYFNAARFGNFSAAPRTGIPLLHQTDIGNKRRCEITSRVHINKMISLFIGAAAEIVHLHYGLITNNNGLFRIDSAGAHVTACSSCRFQQFGGSHFQLVDAAGVDDFDIIDFVIAPYKAEDQSFFALVRNRFYRFFYR